MKSLYTPAFLKYLLLNLALLLIGQLIILKLLGAETDDFSAWLPRLQVVSLLILAVQYPLLVKFQNWVIRVGLFLTGMIVGLALVGMLASSSNMASGAVLTVLIGSILGLFPCIVIVLINWLFEKQLYSAP
jgi:hypothetical protein